VTGGAHEQVLVASALRDVGEGGDKSAADFAAVLGVRKRLERRRDEPLLAVGAGDAQDEVPRRLAPQQGHAGRARLGGHRRAVVERARTQRRRASEDRLRLQTEDGRGAAVARHDAAALVVDDDPLGQRLDDRAMHLLGPADLLLGPPLGAQVDDEAGNGQDATVGVLGCGLSREHVHDAAVGGEHAVLDLEAAARAMRRAALGHETVAVVRMDDGQPPADVPDEVLRGATY
jgi:hypothetical protein